MYATIESFLEDWKMETAATLRVFGTLTDRSLSQKAYTEGRSLGFIAWHIVLMMGEMGSKAGLPVEAPPEEMANRGLPLKSPQPTKGHPARLRTSFRRAGPMRCWTTK